MNIFFFLVIFSYAPLEKISGMVAQAEEKKDEFIVYQRRKSKKD
jgi:hypothetical protein